MSVGETPQQPLDVVGNYVVEGRLGAGGMATVFLVRHQRLGSHHALKVINLAHPEAHARLEQEGRLQATLRHPNIVRVTDMVQVNGQPGLVMEYVDGPSLAELLEAHPLSIQELELLGRGILRGLAAAHEKGFVHRDLKPANILIDIQDGQLVPKIADFGLARALHEHHLDGAGGMHTPAGRVMGTMRYMAPEQYSGSAVGASADVWAVGCVLYEMATGVPAFDYDTLDKCVVAVGAGDFVHPSTLRPELPEELASAICAALTVDRAERIGSARDLEEVWLGAELPTGEISMATIAAVRAGAPSVSALRTPVAGPPGRQPTLSPLDSADSGGLRLFDRTRTNVQMGRTGASTSAQLLGPDPTTGDLTRQNRSMLMWGGLVGVALRVGALLLLAVGIGFAIQQREAERLAVPVQVDDPAPELVDDPAPELVDDPAPDLDDPAPDPVELVPPAAPSPVVDPPAVADSPVPKPPPEPAVVAPVPAEVPEAAPTGDPPGTDAPGTTDPEVPTWPLTLTSRPLGAEVWIDGELVGVTPLAGVQVPEGAHRVRMRLGDADSGDYSVMAGSRLPTRYTWKSTTGEWSSAY